MERLKRDMKLEVKLNVFTIENLTSLNNKKWNIKQYKLGDKALFAFETRAWIVILLVNSKKWTVKIVLKVLPKVGKVADSSAIMI